MQTKTLAIFFVFMLSLQSCQEDQKTGGRPPENEPSGFSIKRDGFRFANYMNSPNVVNLTPENLERLCGPATCERGHKESCVPSAAMQSFMDTANTTMGRGHCEGMNVLAQAIYDKHVSLRTLDDNAKTTYELPFNSRVQAEIAYWFATQLTFPIRMVGPEPTASAALAQLRGANETYSIMICTPDRKDCHSLSPVEMGADKSNDAIVGLRVYDSNYPGNVSQVLGLDTALDSWRYQYYSGGANSKTFTLRPFSGRLNVRCPAFGNRNSLVKKASYEVWLDGNGTIEASSATVIPRASDAQAERRGLEPIYLFETGEEAKISIQGKELKTEESTRISVFAEGQALTINGIKLDSKEVDKVVVGKNGDSISYSTDDDEKIVLELAATYEGADYSVKIHPIQKALGFDVELKNAVDAEKGNHRILFKMKSRDAKASTFTIELTRIDKASDQIFTHIQRPLSVVANETIIIEYGKWLKDKQDLTIKRDKNSDGKPEKTDSVKDDA